MARIPIPGAEHIMGATVETPTQATAYTEGWHACMRGEDMRFTCPYTQNSDEEYAWLHGALDAMEAEDDEEPQPETMGY